MPTDLAVSVAGGESRTAHAPSDHETWMLQLEGEATLHSTVAGGVGEQEESASEVLAEGSCGIVPAGVPFTVVRPRGSIGLVVARLGAATTATASAAA